MTITEWFDGRSVDEHYERCNWSRILTEIACAVVAGIILAGLPGCATPDYTTQVCMFQLVGQTPEGNPVVRQFCMTPEKFAESQK